MPDAPDDVFDNFQNLFADFFGATSPGPPRGADLSMPLALSLAEAVEGCRREVTVERPVCCVVCDGTGAARGSSPVPCPECRGGKVVQAEVGQFKISRTCARCRGAGEVPARPCGAGCDLGLVRSTETLTVTVPPGTTDGLRLRLEGKGGERAGAPSGDLFLALAVEVPSGMAIEGANLVTELVLDEDQSRRGGRHAVASLSGRTEVDVPAGVTDEQRVVVAGHGLPRAPSEAGEHYRHGGARGDLVVIVRVRTTSPKGAWAMVRSLFHKR